MHTAVSCKPIIINTNQIKIWCLLFCFFSFFYLSFSGINVRVHLFNRPIGYEPTRSWGMKTENRLVNIVCSCGWLLFKNKHFVGYIMAITCYTSIRWDDDGCPLCTKPIRRVHFYSANSLKQQSADRHVASLGHIILIPSQPIFALTP
jgi:hypothetical protein